MKRRWKLLLGFLVVLLVAAAVGMHHGLRYPPLQWDPAPRPLHALSEEGWSVEAEGAYSRGVREGVLHFRAFVPEPSLSFRSNGAEFAKVVVENIHPDAFIYEDGLRDKAEGLQRTVSLPLKGTEQVTLSFKFPTRGRYRFAAIGDAGGGPQLRHCLERAKELNADFVLHLGDIAYLEDDFENGAKNFLQSPLPIYVTCGNHDFHGGHRNRHRFFSENFGPLNSGFALGEVHFLNLDTAADLLWPWQGERGKLLEAFEETRAQHRAKWGDGPLPPLVVFTHRPLNDPRMTLGRRKKAHALNFQLEANWLRKKLLELEATVLLAGHIHESHHFNDEGLDTWIAGEGLSEGTTEASILIGEFGPGETPVFRWEPLNMPVEYTKWRH
ncbi:MAG: hypothetical protein DWQ01_08845 [Planctomycetota bacterium]|nr:MAG: hypothetical protein DWQ01_08845 [Planctomycetota bacterium]